MLISAHSHSQLVYNWSSIAALYCCIQTPKLTVGDKTHTIVMNPHCKAISVSWRIAQKMRGLRLGFASCLKPIIARHFANLIVFFWLLNITNCYQSFFLNLTTLFLCLNLKQVPLIFSWVACVTISLRSEYLRIRRSKLFVLPILFWDNFLLSHLIHQNSGHVKTNHKNMITIFHIKATLCDNGILLLLLEPPWSSGM